MQKWNNTFYIFKEPIGKRWIKNFNYTNNTYIYLLIEAKGNNFFSYNRVSIAYQWSMRRWSALNMMYDNRNYAVIMRDFCDAESQLLVCKNIRFSFLLIIILSAVSIINVKIADVAFANKNCWASGSPQRTRARCFSLY